MLLAEYIWYAKKRTERRRWGECRKFEIPGNQQQKKQTAEETCASSVMYLESFHRLSVWAACL